MENILMFIIGVVFIAGGGLIAKEALDSKNLIETALFAMIGVSTGLFLIITAIVGPPNY